MIRTGEMLAMFAGVPQPQQAGRRAVSLSLALCLAVLLCGSVARAQSVAFINPGKSDEIYWVTATQGMQAAAHSLGMTFEVRYAQREPLKTLDIAREMVARPAGKRPEYIVITDDYSVADRLLAIIDPAGLKTFLAYSSIPVDQRGGIGSPRQVQGLARLAGAAGGGRRLSDGARANRARQERKSIRARRQASHAGDRRRSLHTLVDQPQPGHAPRGRRSPDGRPRGGGLRGVGARERRPASRVALPALSRCQARVGG